MDDQRLTISYRATDENAKAREFWADMMRQFEKLCRKYWVVLTASIGRAVIRWWPVWLGKVLVWRVINRLNARLGIELIARTRWGGRFKCNLRDLVQSRIYYTGVWEPSLTQLITENLSPGDVFVDVGANVGYFTVLAARIVGAKGRVIAIEASPRIHALLCENIRLNELDNVVVHHCAVSDTNGTAELYDADETNIGSTSLIQSVGGAPASRVETRQLDGILSDAELRNARIIKIDVEGFEGPVLRSLMPHVERLRDDVHIAVELAPTSLAQFGMTAEEVLVAMTSAGFEPAVLHNSYDWDGWYDTQARRPVPLVGVPTSQVDLVFAKASRRSLR